MSTAQLRVLCALTTSCMGQAYKMISSNYIFTLLRLISRLVTFAMRRRPGWYPVEIQADHQVSAIDVGNMKGRARLETAS